METAPTLTVWRGIPQGNIYRCGILAHGLRSIGIPVLETPATRYVGIPAPSVGCGTRYGLERIFKDCQKTQTEWWNLDNGFFGSGKRGYFRIGFCHLQPVWRKEARVDGSRWEKFRIVVKPWRPNPDGHILFCPPTRGLSSFYGIEDPEWIDQTTARLPVKFRDRVKVRRKGDPGTAAEAISGALAVIVHSSKVAFEALVDGVPAISTEGITKAWNGHTPEMVGEDLTKVDRLELFRYAAWTQFTLDEYRSGAAWRATRSVQAGVVALEPAKPVPGVRRGIPVPPPCEPKFRAVPFPKRPEKACPKCGREAQVGVCSPLIDRHCKICCVRQQYWRVHPF